MSWMGHAPGQGFHARNLYLNGCDPRNEREARHALRLQLNVSRLPAASSVWKAA